MWRIKVVQKFFWNTANWYYCINEVVIYFYEAFLWKNWKLNKLILLDCLELTSASSHVHRYLRESNREEFASDWSKWIFRNFISHCSILSSLYAIPTSYNVFSEKSKANEKEAISIHIILASFELINTQHDQILYHWVRQKTIHTFSGARFWIFR